MCGASLAFPGCNVPARTPAVPRCWAGLIELAMLPHARCIRANVRMHSPPRRTILSCASAAPPSGLSKDLRAAHIRPCSAPGSRLRQIRTLPCHVPSLKDSEDGSNRNACIHIASVMQVDSRDIAYRISGTKRLLPSKGSKTQIYLPVSANSCTPSTFSANQSHGTLDLACFSPHPSASDSTGIKSLSLCPALDHGNATQQGPNCFAPTPLTVQTAGRIMEIPNDCWADSTGTELSPVPAIHRFILLL